MKQSEFCEKMFENLINHELLNKGLDIYIPSQRKESKSGYDALFNGKKKKVFVLQYKVVSQYNKNTYDKMKAEKFKYDIYGKKDKGLYSFNQNKALVRLNKKGIKAGYYVPSFIDYNSLFCKLHNGTLLNHSFLITPEDIIDKKVPHYVVFDENEAWHYCRNPSKVDIFSLETLLDDQDCLQISKETFENIIWEVIQEEQSSDIKPSIDSYLASNKLVIIAK